MSEIASDEAFLSMNHLHCDDACASRWNDVAAKQIIELKEMIAVLRNGLKKLQWSGRKYADASCCPVCGALSPDEDRLAGLIGEGNSGIHKPECWILGVLYDQPS